MNRTRRIILIRQIVIVGGLIFILVVLAISIFQYAKQKAAETEQARKEAEQAQQAAQTRANHEREEQQKRTFGETQNDSEGYHQHPWGVSVDDFRRQVKSYADKNYESLDEACGISGNPDFDIGQVAVCYFEGVPIGNLGFFVSQFMPTGLSKYDDHEDADYYFYQGRLAFVSEFLDGSVGYDAHEFPIEIGSGSFKLASSDKGFYYDLYRRGDTNTRVYYVHHRGFIGPLARLIYIPSSALIQMSDEVHWRQAAGR